MDIQLKWGPGSGNYLGQICAIFEDLLNTSAVIR